MALSCAQFSTFIILYREGRDNEGAMTFEENLSSLVIDGAQDSIPIDSLRRIYLLPLFLLLYYKHPPEKGR